MHPVEFEALCTKHNLVVGYQRGSKSTLSPFIQMAVLSLVAFAANTLTVLAGWSLLGGSVRLHSVAHSSQFRGDGVDCRVRHTRNDSS